MSAQTTRWALAFAITAAIAAAIMASAASAPAAGETVPRRDPSSVTPVELELLLNKIREGDLLALKPDPDGAQRAWREARKAGEGLWPIHEGLGDSYARAKFHDAAFQEYTLAEERVPPKFASAKLGISAKRAATVAAMGRPLEALQLFLDLNQPSVFGPRIFNLAREGDRAAAIQVIERHAEVHDARLFKLVAGLLRSEQRNVDAAEALAKVAIRVEPWNEMLNRQVIQELSEAKRTDTALEVARAWVRALPEALEGYQAMGDVLWDAGRKPEALVAYSSIVDVRPADASARRRLGEIYRRRDLPDEALAQFEAGLKLAPDDAELRQRVVDVHKARLATMQGAEAVALRRKLGSLKVQDVGLFDLKIVMTWDVQSDVDLDVVEPDGTRINHNNRVSKVGGVYLTDNTTGHGPETYTLFHATPGTYQVGAHLHSGAKSAVKFVILLHEGTPQEERREESLLLERSGEAVQFVRDILIR